MGERWRIVFFSMVLPAVQGLDVLARACGHEPVALITTPPRAAEESRRRFAELVTDAPEGLDVIVVRRRDRLAEHVRALEPDLVMCLGFAWLIPREVIEIPRLGIVNGHPSLLPRYRGPIPIAWAFRNGDAEVGMTWHLMDERFDTGPILAQATRPRDEEDYFEDVIPKLREMTMELVPQVFDKLARGERGEPQTEEGASYAGFFDEEYLRIDWARPRREIHNQVRAWQMAFAMDLRGALAELDGEEVRVLRTSLQPREDAREVQAGDGPIWILQTEPA